MPVFSFARKKGNESIWEGREELRGTEGEKNIVRIYYVYYVRKKSIFNKGKKIRVLVSWNSFWLSGWAQFLVIVLTLQWNTMTKSTYKRQNLTDCLIAVSNDEFMDIRMGIRAVGKKTRHWKISWDVISHLQERKREWE